MLLLGRSSAQNPGGFENLTSLHARIILVQGVVDRFWKAWTQYYAPTLVRQSKWIQEGKGINVGDVVLVADSNVLKGEYRLARVVKTTKSKDGIVRRATVAYKNYKVGEDVRVYKGAKDSTVERSIQNLSLLIPVEES